MSSEHQFSEERQALFYIGNILMFVGFLLFISVFLQGVALVNSASRTTPVMVPSFDPNSVKPKSDSPPANFFPSRPTQSNHPSEPNFMVAVIGMGFAVLGGFLRSLGAGGLTGAGVVLDPELQRQEQKPWSKMEGGMMQDALSELDLSKSLPSQDKHVVKVRCQSCRTLNDENAKFCDECGKAI